MKKNVSLAIVVSGFTLVAAIDHGRAQIPDVDKTGPRAHKDVKAHHPAKRIDDRAHGPILPSHRKRGGRMPHHNRHHPDLDAVLKLSPDQQAKLTSIRRVVSKNMVRKKAEIDVARLDLHALIEDGSDRRDIHQQIEAIAILQGELHILHVDERLDILGHLTEKQQDIFQTLHHPNIPPPERDRMGPMRQRPFQRPGKGPG